MGLMTAMNESETPRKTKNLLTNLATNFRVQPSSANSGISGVCSQKGKIYTEIGNETRNL